MKRHLAITMGDPAGIGPEIIVKAAARLKGRLEAGDLRLAILGSGPSLRLAEQQLGLDTAIPKPRWTVTGRTSVSSRPTPRASRSCRACSPPMAAAWPFKAIEKGVQLALSGKIGGIVTAPLNKEALNKAGFHYAGHTELLAELTGARGSVMMLAHGNMRVSHVTTHVALEDVPKRLTPERLRLVIDLTDKALKHLGIAQAENRDRGAQSACRRRRPVRSAGYRYFRADDRQGGRRRVRYRRPGPRRHRLRQAARRPIRRRRRHVSRSRGISRSSCWASRSIPPPANGWTSPASTSPSASPIVRTSVDHGTAFDIAGKGIANERSFDRGDRVCVERLATGGLRRVSLLASSLSVCRASDTPLSLSRHLPTMGRALSVLHAQQ